MKDFKPVLTYSDCKEELNKERNLNNMVLFILKIIYFKGDILIHFWDRGVCLS